MKFSIEVEEKIPLDQVTNFNEVIFPVIICFTTLDTIMGEHFHDYS